MNKLFATLPDLEPGWVWLTGAGPGDPGLLTLLAVKGLSMADVIVCDALVDKSILDLARPGVVLEYAGKRGGKPSAKQPDISLRLGSWRGKASVCCASRAAIPSSSAVAARKR